HDGPTRVLHTMHSPTPLTSFRRKRKRDLSEGLSAARDRIRELTTRFLRLGAGRFAAGLLRSRLQIAVPSTAGARDSERGGHLGDGFVEARAFEPGFVSESTY